jgi:uncharacterized protein (TIGR03435 family)
LLLRQQAILYKHTTMKKTGIAFFATLTVHWVMGQPAPLKAGDVLPQHVIRPVINAPVTALDVGKYNKKILILNFWGTWCTPCIPEMDSLARLQQKNNSTIQVVGISNEKPERLRKYLQRKPSSVWLASDTATYLYKRFGLNSVGQCAIINKDHKIVTVTRTDSVNQQLIDKVLKGEPVPSYAETGKQRLAEKQDPFGVDSNAIFSVSLKPYLPGVTSMGKGYKHTPFEGRRKSYINICASIMYKDAYDVHSQQLVVYENLTEKQVCDFKDTAALFCYDLLVKPAQKDSLLIMMQKTLNELLPIKARIEKRAVSVYILTKNGQPLNMPVSAAANPGYSYSGTGFEGTGIPLKTFVDYLCNELDLPVYDETGLAGKYDIKTENDLRTKKDIVDALGKLGLTIEKGERLMEVLILYK